MSEPSLMPPHATPQQSGPDASAQLLQQALAHHRAGRLLEAGTFYQTLLQSQPDHAEANYNLGVIAVQAQQSEAALPYFVAALNADPTHGRYWVNYIDALEQAGQLDDARTVLALARQQGLEGDAVDTLAARLDEDARAAAPAGAVDPAASDAAASGDSPGPEDMAALMALYAERQYAALADRAQRMSVRYPLHAFGWKILGVALKLQGKGDQALEPLRQAAALAPADVETHYNLGVTLQELGRLDEAEARYRQALEIDPVYADAYLNLGVTLSKLGRLDEAEARLRQALLLRPNYAEAHSNLGATLLEQGRLDEAESSYRQALQLAPDNARAHTNLGITLQRLDRLDEAETSCRRAVELMPEDAEVHGNLGNVLRESGRLDEAEASFRQALRIRTDDVAMHNNLAITLQERGRLDEADTHFQLALYLDPNDARSYENRANLLRFMERLDEAETNYRKALQIAPEEAGLHLNMGKLMRVMNRLDEAEACFRRALEIRPDEINALNNLGVTLQYLGRLDEAVGCYRRILQVKPNNAGALANLGTTLLSLGRLDEAEACSRQALQIKPDHATLHSNLLYSLSLSASTDPHALFLEHVRFGEQFEPALRPHWPAHTQSRDPERRLQVGFVSADFYNHAVATFIEPVIAQLSGHPRLSLHAYYNNFFDDEVTARLRGHFAHWHPVAGLSDAALADKIHADGIDILIDLSGHTGENRLLVFARKPAPIQVSWIGYPGTTGLRAVDYFLVDRFLFPSGQFDDQFTEKIVRLPANSPFQPSGFAPPVNALPALSNGYVTFGSFNRTNKLNRDVIAVWSQLLRALPDSRMLLGGLPESGSCEALIARFAEEGVAPSRLEFHPRSNIKDYLALHHRVDICLDTFPYNGGTTTHHALWMGVPTLTLVGTGTPGRVGLAILSGVGLQDFAVGNADDFVAQGLYWSNNLAALDTLRGGLRARLSQSPSRNPAIIAAGLDRALRTMWRRWCEGKPAESFDVHLDEAASATQDTGK